MVTFYAYIRQTYQENKNRKLTSEDIENTVSCKREGASLREAGYKNGVPRATLARYLHNNPLCIWSNNIIIFYNNDEKLLDFVQRNKHVRTRSFHSIPRQPPPPILIIATSYQQFN